jgi:uncharacterized membrane protein YfcA
VNWIEYDFSVWQWVLLGVCGVLAGLSKTGLPGVGILVVPLMALLMPARQSTGVLLPMLIFADLFSAGYYRHHAQWGHLVRLLPAALAGIVAGYLLMRRIDDRQLAPVIGVIVLGMLALKAKTMFSQGASQDKAIRAGRWFGWLMGFAAGVTTMMANAAGPVMVLYLLAMGMDKQKFVGTAAWFFFVVNWAKVPFSVGLGLITWQSLKLDVLTFPAVALGAVAGIVLLKYIPQKWFNILALLLAAAAAVKLLF